MAEGLQALLGETDYQGACWSPSGCSCSAVTLLAPCLQEVLWQRLGKSFEQLHRSAVTVWHLQRVLVKKRDPLTHVCFMDAYLATEDTPLPSDAAWCVRVGPAVGEACSEASVAQFLGTGATPSTDVAAWGARVRCLPAGLSQGSGMVCMAVHLLTSSG